ncbi:DUF1980 domain-containing protein [Paenibacillus sp. NPDC058071]|uniref:DUF1980 domain-containing protein n=1 Tax=Paenibacillus sp. NPDC058071 TaxID=3346326 RepID=UPI0036D9AA99
MTHNWIKAALLAGFALLIVYLDYSGQLPLLAAGWLEPLIRVSSFILLAFAFHQAYTASSKSTNNHSASCGCGMEDGHHHHHNHHNHNHADHLYNHDYCNHSLDDGHHNYGCVGQIGDHSDKNNQHDHSPTNNINWKSVFIYFLFLLPLLLGFFTPALDKETTAWLEEHVHFNHGHHHP